MVYANGGGTFTSSYSTYLNSTSTIYTRDYTKSSETSYSLYSSMLTAKTGKIFAGWATSASGSNICTSSAGTYTFYPTKDNLTFYALWANTYTVKFNANGGTFSSSATTSYSVRRGYAATLSPSEPTRAKYRFMGWATDKKGKHRVLVDSSSYKPTKNITFYAVWASAPYAVKFYSNGGTFSVDGAAPKYIVTYLEKSQYLKYSTGGFTDGNTLATMSTTTYLTAPTGKIFGGWNTRADGKGKTRFPADTSSSNKLKITKSVTLYAKWLGTYTLTWKANYDDSTYSDKTSTVAKGGTVSASSQSFSRTGYTQSGWKTSTGVRVKSTNTAYKPTGDTTFLAVWVKNPTITLVADTDADKQGVFTTGSTTITYTSAAKNSSVSGSSYPFSYARLNGYSATGWATDKKGSKVVLSVSGGTASTTYTVKSDVTLYAVYSGYIVTLNGNGGTYSNASTSSSRIALNTTITYASQITNGSSYSRTGYTFRGWSTTKKAKNIVIYANTYLGTTNYKIKKNQTLYAIWSKNKAVKLYATKGYYVGDNFSGTVQGNSSKVYTYTLTNDGYDSTIMSSSSSTLIANGKLLKGWAKKANGKKVFFKYSLTDSTVALTESILRKAKVGKAYAVWAKGYRLTGNDNWKRGGGTWSSSSDARRHTTTALVRKGARYSFAALTSLLGGSATSTAGKVLVGWSTDAKGKKKVAKAGTADQTFKVKKNQKLYAVWSSKYSGLVSNSASSTYGFSGGTYLRKGKTYSKFTGVTTSQFGYEMYVVKGTIDTAFSGYKFYKRILYNIWYGSAERATALYKDKYYQDGVFQSSASGILTGGDVKYYIKNGCVQTKYNGILNMSGKKYYVKKGIVQTSVSGRVKIKGKYYTVKNGEIVK